MKQEVWPKFAGLYQRAKSINPKKEKKREHFGSHGFPGISEPLRAGVLLGKRDLFGAPKMLRIAQGPFGPRVEEVK